MTNLQHTEPTDAQHNTDAHWMQRAIELAKQGLYTTTPNPRVGCVMIKNGLCIGEGFHPKAGLGHAEVFALQQAGKNAIDSTAYVTLEPCSHTGRTPPCANTLIAHKVKRVVIAMVDPNPLVSGQGIRKLQDAGIEVTVGVLEDQARELNLGFVSRMTRGLPWVRLKAAISLDGFTALPDGTSQWITGEVARHDGHHWRAQACAILTGIGTVLEDDPQLNVRGINTPRQPLKIIVDSQLQTPLTAKVLQSGSVLIAHAVTDPQANTLEHMQALMQQDVELLCCPNPSKKVDLHALLKQLAERGLNEIHVEAGGKLNGSLIREQCVDELLIYQAPCLLGAGKPMAILPAVNDLNRRHAFSLTEVTPMGSDLRMRFVRSDKTI